MDVSPWVEFGLAGLFGVFAIIVIRLFLAYLDKQNEQWRHHLSEQNTQWRQGLDKLDGTIKDLHTTIQKINSK